MGSTSYAALRGLSRLAQCMALTEDEGPRRNTVPALLQQCSGTSFYHLNPCM
jgi:hypothetical protein